MIGFVWLRPDVLLVFEDDLRLLKIEGDIKYIPPADVAGPPYCQHGGASQDFKQ